MFADTVSKFQPTIKEKIRQRRSQMLVHSYLYYIEDTPIISDDTWQRWANELVELQRENPFDCNIDFFDKEFSDWTGDTGFHLPLKNPKVKEKAIQIFKMNCLPGGRCHE